MKKCAETLKGKAGIRFEPTRTVFTFSCPATQFDQVMLAGSVNPMTFQIPSNTWGIAVDDSKIQRKLLGNLLSCTGIEPTRQIILGSTTKEITEFVDFVVQLVDQNPLDYFLLIVA